MFAKIFAGLLVAAAMVMLAPVARAQDKTHEGKVVSAAADKLVMTDKEGKNEHTHMLTAATKVTVDGKAATPTDLKKGDAVKVTVDATGKVSAVAVSRAG